MVADDPDSGLHAQASLPSRLDSVPAARAFLTKLLQGWSVAEDVVDDAALLTTEIMANALEHGDGLVSVTIALAAGTLRVGVVDNADRRQPHILSVDSESSAGRGMWIVDVVAQAWGTQPTGNGKTVWFELSAFRLPDGTVALAEIIEVPLRPGP
jgi:anti-sigma regulatory factor (Ser/Thr protein kinase)